MSSKPFMRDQAAKGGCLVHGVITPGASPTFAGNDDSISVAQNATGDYSVTIGHVFTGVPTVMLINQDTLAVTEANVCVLISAAAGLIRFNIVNANDTGAAVLIDSEKIHIMIAGTRDH
jgi:hypothetical protein